MVKRSTWVMVILLAVLSGLAYYLQQPDNMIKKAFAGYSGTPTAEPLGMLFTLPPGGAINGISVQNAEGRSAGLKHEAAGWTLSLDGGGSMPADQGASDGVSSQAQSLRLVAKIDSQSPISAFGLDKPAYTSRLDLDDGKSVTFKIGNATLAGDGYYLQKEDGSIVVVDKSGMDTLLNLITQPPYMFTPTPSPAATETPTITPTLAPTETMPASSTPEMTPLTKLTPTKQP